MTKNEFIKKFKILKTDDDLFYFNYISMPDQILEKWVDEYSSEDACDFFETDDEEVEVGYALADVLARSGDRARAMALLEDIALKQPEGTYGRLAKHALAQLAFERRAEALIGVESPRRP